MSTLELSIKAADITGGALAANENRRSLKALYSSQNPYNTEPTTVLNVHNSSTPLLQRTFIRSNSNRLL